MVKPNVLIAALPAAHALFLPFDNDGEPLDIQAVHGDIVPPAQPLLEAVQGELPKPKGKHHGKPHAKHHGKPHGKHHDKPERKNEDRPEPKDGDKPERKGRKHEAHRPAHVPEFDHHDQRPADIPAPLYISESARPHMIEDSYIIRFKKGVDPALVSEHLVMLETAHSEHGGASALGDDSGVDKVYNIGEFKGYAGKFLPQTVDFIRTSPLVAHVEHDSKVYISNEHLENGAPWGLARVSHRKGLSLGTYNKYLYDDEGGEDVTAYVIDTGVYIDHEDFEGRAKWGKTVPANDYDKDAHGHGTHCAGTIAGSKYGVAKKANVVAVKVLGSNGSGTMSDVIGGVEYVVDAHEKDMANGKKGSTANMSLGGGRSPSLDMAVNAAVNKGVHFAVAAGNENQDACNSSPASASEAITVGATTLSDDRAYFSNYGKCVDVFAPGVNILSAGIASKASTQIMSGTSMASPHVCGLLTYFVSLQPTSKSAYAQEALTPKQLKKHLISFGTKDVLDDIDSESPNVLVYNGGGKSLDNFFAAMSADHESAFSTAMPLTDLVKEAGSEVMEELQHAADYVLNVFEEIF